MVMTKEEEDLVEPYKIFGALSDPQRAAILKALRKKGEMSFTELMKTIDAASGRLAFQLSKLSSLLEKTEEKYKLSPLGYGALDIFDVAETLLCSPDEREYRKGIIVRKANPQDAQATAEVTLSWVDKWYRTRMGKVYETSLGELTREEIEEEAGSHSVPEYLQEAIRDAPKRKGAFYVAVVEGKVVGFLDFPFGLTSEPEPWGRRLGGLISIHRECVQPELAEALLRRALETGRHLHVEYVSLGALAQAPKLTGSIEEALKKLPSAEKIDYSYLRAQVSEIPRDHKATIREGTEDTLLYQRLKRNRSITWANQASPGARKDYPVEPEKGQMLITIDDKTCALEFYEEFVPDEASLELYPEPEDWTDKRFIQEAVKAGADVAREQGYGKVEVVVEKTIEQWFKELGFEEWEPQTEYERLTGKSHEGRFWEKGPSYLLKV